ncbi:MAG: glycosyltransferase family 4 protein, partial [Planctomycetes bacterium]|nr:glycosyltransferase family 4 protein [Planctomycetota bacterium]
VGGVPEIVDHRENGILVDPHSPEQLAESIIRLLEDERMRSRLGKTARETACTTFSRERCLKDTERVYEAALGA